MICLSWLIGGLFIWYSGIVKLNIRLLYLYLFSFVGLLVVVIGSIQLVDLGMKVFLFKGADQYEYVRPIPVKEESLTREELTKREEEDKMIQEREMIRNRQRQFSTAMAMIIVGVPLYLYHWKTIGRERA
mgnify:CR=1 FL=1